MTPCAAETFLVEARGSGALDPKQNSSLHPELPGDTEAMTAPTSWVPGMPRPETRVQGILAGKMDRRTLARDPWPRALWAAGGRQRLINPPTRIPAHLKGFFYAGAFSQEL